MDTPKCRSLVALLAKLDINDSIISNNVESDLSFIDQSLGVNENSNNITQPQESNDDGGSRADLPCRMPQTAGDTADESDDTDPASDGIVVVDSLDVTEDLSLVIDLDSSLLSNLNTPVELWDLDSSTILETNSESIFDGSASETSIMEHRLRTPSKRKHDCHSDRASKEPESPGFSPVKSTPEKINKSPLVAVTRSGRTVRARIDHKFDYSSEEYSSVLDDSHVSDFNGSPKVASVSPRDVAEDSFGDDNDNDYMDSESSSDSDDGDEYDLPQGAPSRRYAQIARRRSSIHEKLESDRIIYLDSRQHIAIASNEPTTDTNAVENDVELKTQVHMFLGQVPARRRLYNPMDNYDQEDNYMNTDQNDEQPMQRFRLWASKADNAQKKVEPTELPPRLQHSGLNTLFNGMTSDMKMLMFSEKVQRENAMCYERQTPQHIKEPIDLTCLPSEEQRRRICKQHNNIIKDLEPNDKVYSFVNSLRFDTPLNMCHPLAKQYYNSDMRTCRKSLARTLFNMFNHTIFHCGLRLSIHWNTFTSSSVSHYFEAGGQRMSRIMLSTLVKHPMDLVKPLLHEMCHAAAFVYHGEAGHGDNCRKWAYRAKSLMPELPQIDDCGNSFRYTCGLCQGQSFGICNFKDVEKQLRCHYCQFEVKVEPYSMDNIQFLSISNQQNTPYKKYVRDSYLKCQQQEQKTSHSSKMLAINAQYMKQNQS